MTGAVRGVLCWDCNKMLGNARDQSRILLAAVDYLRSSGTDASSMKVAHG